MVSSTGPPMNTWEVEALNYEFPDQLTSAPDGEVAPTTSQWRQLQDPIIYPGLYSATGFDVMQILLQIISRPNPKVELGPVDCSVALVVCDLELPDHPIVYASDSFTQLTGYSNTEALGQNCRFLQNHGSKAASSNSTSGADKIAIQQMRSAVDRRDEIQLQVTNYKKSGQRFINVLSIIPIKLEGTAHQYAVGFQVELD